MLPTVHFVSKKKQSNSNGHPFFLKAGPHPFSSVSYTMTHFLDRYFSLFRCCNHEIPADLKKRSDRNRRWIWIFISTWRGVEAIKDARHVRSFLQYEKKMKMKILFWQKKWDHKSRLIMHFEFFVPGKGEKKNNGMGESRVCGTSKCGGWGMGRVEREEKN